MNAAQVEEEAEKVKNLPVLYLDSA